MSYSFASLTNFCHVSRLHLFISRLNVRRCFFYNSSSSCLSYLLNLRRVRSACFRSFSRSLFHHLLLNWDFRGNLMFEVDIIYGDSPITPRATLATMCLSPGTFVEMLLLHLHLHESMHSQLPISFPSPQPSMSSVQYTQVSNSR